MSMFCAIFGHSYTTKYPLFIGNLNVTGHPIFYLATLWLILNKSNMRTWHWLLKSLPSSHTFPQKGAWSVLSSRLLIQAGGAPFTRGYHLAILPPVDTDCAYFLIALFSILHPHRRFLSHPKRSPCLSFTWDTQHYGAVLWVAAWLQVDSCALRYWHFQVFFFFFLANIGYHCLSSTDDILKV